MKFTDKETVTRDVAIGRKIQYRKDREGRKVERVSKSYTAEYRDADGNRRHRGLGTTNKRAARQLALELQHELDSGVTRRKPGRLTMVGLIDRY